jgi:hypothetical protein
MLYKLNAVLFFILLIIQTSFSQEQIGLRTGKFSGVNSIFSNPALSSQSALSWDINVFAGHFFAETDYAFVRKTNFFHFLRNKDQITTITDLNNPIDSIVSLPLYFDTNGGDKAASVKASVMGPSAIFNIGKGFTAGFYFSFNINSTAQNIPQSLGYYELQDIPVTLAGAQDSFNITVIPSRFAAISWTEIGLHLSKTLFNSSYTNTAVGFNFKYLIGYDAAYAKNHSPVVFSKLEEDRYFFNTIEAELGFTTTSLDSSSLEFKSNGRGIAMDIGFSVKSEKNQWGISLLDFGFIRFNKNVEIHRFSSDNALNIDGQNYQNINDYRAFLNQTSQDFPEINRDSINRNSRPFSIWLPTALSLQYDRKLSEKFFINFSMISRIPIGSNRVERDNIIYAAPRFETRFISLYLPFTLYDFNKIHIGFAARLGVFSVGSDNIASLFGKRDFDGTDLYAAVKINPFQRAGNSNKEIKCFYFDTK